MSKKLSPAKETVIEFAKIGMDEEFVFHLPDANESDAKKFVQFMRVELSRMRSYVKSRGRVVKSFKMLLISIKKDEEKGGCIVTLKKSGARHQQALELIDEAFDHLAGGKIVNV